MAIRRKFLDGSRVFFHEDAYRRSLDAVGLTRRFPGTSLTKASRLVGTTTKTVKKYAGVALEERSGRLYVKPTDRLRRRMRLLTPHGEVAVTTTSSRTASRVSRYSIAVQNFYVTGTPANSSRSEVKRSVAAASVTSSSPIHESSIDLVAPGQPISSISTRRGPSNERRQRKRCFEKH